MASYLWLLSFLCKFFYTLLTFPSFFFAISKLLNYLEFSK
ncbi:hypothetical protein BACSTE_00565 [Bacteroides stercoris ATCC 43183]|uniref:Uncharacterized protein n=1 Tax=Bacteroides stercoris ATCC 43183 TaxID=449673 RepID=B0NMA7_BACSE|nr:hypothetical protein BACSTE_00565 [Bacteroides stercoris ATCC 43183]